MENEKLVNSELENKTYTIENLPNHIKNFVDVQYKTTTQNNYQLALTKYYNYLQNTQTKNITQANINRLIKEYKSNLENSTNLASTSIDNYIEIVKVFSNTYLDLNVKKIKKNHTGKSKKIKYLEIEDIKGLINTVEYTTGNLEQITRDKAIICTLFGAGLRISELLNIKVEDYDNERNTLLIVGKGKAIDEEEIIAIPQQTANYLNNYLQQRREHNRECKYLFCSLKDKQLTRQTANKIIKKIANEYDKRNDKNIAGRVSTHTFRHSLARYLLVTNKLPINQVKDILRHSNIETTAKYLNNTQEEITQLRKEIIF